MESHLVPVSVLSTWPGVCLSITLCLLCISWCFKLKVSSKKQAITHWPFIGALPSILWNSHRLNEWLTEVFFSLGNGVGSFSTKGPLFSNFNYLATCHPGNIEYILKTNFSNFPKGSDFKELFDILGDGILNSDGESWRLQRRMVHTFLKSVDFRTAVGRIIQKVVEFELVPVLAHVARQGIIVDLQDICRRLAFDTNMTAIFGRDEMSLSIDLPHNEFAKAIDAVQDAVIYRHAMPMFCWKLLRFLNVGRERNLAKARKTMDLLLEEYISLKRECLNKGEENTIDFLSLAVKSPDESLMNNKFLKDILLNLFMAGRDTITSGLVWFFWMVAKTPHVHKKIMEELETVAWKKSLEDKCGNKIKWPRVFSFDDLKGLVYLHGALCETLRLYSPVPFNSKSVIKEDVLPDGTVVKPGTQIVICFYSEGKMPWIWGEDSLDFKPERWIDDEGKLSYELLSKFFAFNIGPRSCLGKDMSFCQMKVCVAAVLFNFQVELVDGQQVCSNSSINLGMKNGLLVKIQERLRH